MPTTEHGAARSDLRGVFVSLPQVADASHELGSPSRWLHTPHGAATVATACRDSLRGGLLLPVLVVDHVWAGTRAQAGPYLRFGKSSGVAGPQAFGWRTAHGVRREAGTGLLVSRHETRGALTITYTQDCHCTPPCWARRLACSGSATASPEVRGVGIRRARARRLLSAARKSAASRSVFAGPALACMAREMGPPRRGEDCAGAFTRAPVAQLEERPSSKRRRAGSSPAWSTTHPRSSEEERRFPELMVAGSSPAVGNFPFREVTK